MASSGLEVQSGDEEFPGGTERGEGNNSVTVQGAVVISDDSGRVKQAGVLHVEWNGVEREPSGVLLSSSLREVSVVKADTEDERRE